MRLQNEIILTSLWRGPEILWRTSLRVIGGPYEIAPALSDTMSFEKGDEWNARQIIEKRSVNFVLVCDAEHTGDFVDRLRRGSAPGWLQPVGLPGSPAGFRLYRVN